LLSMNKFLIVAPATAGVAAVARVTGAPAHRPVPSPP
jgi:hypothetical protein